MRLPLSFVLLVMSGCSTTQQSAQPSAIQEPPRTAAAVADPTHRLAITPPTNSSPAKSSAVSTSSLLPSAPSIEAKSKAAKRNARPPTVAGSSRFAKGPIYTGPRGGRYHYSASGKKVYERKRR